MNLGDTEQSSKYKIKHVYTDIFCLKKKVR